MVKCYIIEIKLITHNCLDMLMQMQDMKPTVSTPSAYEEADAETTDPDNGATSLVSTTTVTGGSGAMVTSANIDTKV